MIDENLNMYRERAQNLPSIVNWKKINDEIVNLCDDTVSLLNKSNNILRRKATEILLFLITDTDREFQKELPISVPIAYGMKGKSIRLDTVRKMMNVVRDELKEHNCNVLVEALDGQWAGLIFRDEIKKPLTFYELDKDCWQKFSLKSKIGVMTLMEQFSFVSGKHLEAFSKLKNVDEGNYKTGNIGVTVQNKLRTVGKETRMQKILYLYSFCGNLEEECGLKTLRMLLNNSIPIYGEWIWA